MTDVARRQELVPAPTGLQRIVGTQFEVDAKIMEYRRAGRLRKKTRPVPVAGLPGVVEAWVVLSRPAGKTVPRTVAAVAGVALLAVAAAVWWVVANLAAILAVLAGVALAAAVLFVLLGQVGACPGIHCPGCKHR